MQSHDHHSNVALKLRRKKLSKKKSDQSTQSSCWSSVAISHDKKSHESNDLESNLSQFDSTVNDSNVVVCDIVELLCDMSNEERPTCSRISSSKESEEQINGVCSTCKDCTECQLQQQQQQQDCTVVKIRKTKEEEDQDEDLTEHLDYYEAEVGGETDSMIASIEHEKAPILVDLTSEESRQITWKQTILKRFGDTEESSEMSGENVITSKSGSRHYLPSSIFTNFAVQYFLENIRMI